MKLLHGPLTIISNMLLEKLPAVMYISLLRIYKFEAILVYTCHKALIQNIAMALAHDYPFKHSCGACHYLS